MLKQSKTVSLVLVLLVAFIDHLGIGIVFPIFSTMLYHDDCTLISPHSSDLFRGFCLGTLLASMPITQFFAAPILGTLSDQKGRKGVLLGSLAIGVMGYLLGVVALTVDNLFLLLFSRVLVGISAGSTSVVNAAIADLSTPEEKATNFGYYSLVCGLSFTIGPLLGGLLFTSTFAGLSGVSLSFLFSGAVLLVNLVMLAYYYHDVQQTHPLKKMNWVLGFQNIQKAFRLKGLCVLFLMVFFLRFGWSCYWYMAPVAWINTYAFSPSEISWLYAYGSAIFAFSCAFLLPPLTRRFSLKKMIFYATIACGISILMLQGNDGTLWLLLCVSLQQYFMALIMPTTTTLVSNSGGTDIQGEILGIQSSVQALAIALSPILSGALMGLNRDLPMIIGALSLFAAALILGISIQWVKVAKQQPDF